MNHNASSLSASVFTSLPFLALAFCTSARAGDLYWNQSNYRADPSIYLNHFNTPGNWSTDAAGTTPSTLAPASTDNLFFNSTPNNSLGGTVAIESVPAVFANSITFNTSGPTTFGPNNNRILTLGGGGITVNAGAGNVTFGTSSRAFPVELAADQTWTNNSTSTLSTRVLRASDTAPASSALTLNAASSGNIILSSAGQGLTDSPNLVNKLALAVDSTGAGEVITAGTTATNNYTGGTTIRQGVLRANGALGATTGEVRLGHTSGTAAAKLRINGTGALANDLNVQAGGTNTLEFMNTGGGNWSGTIALNNTLNVAVVSGGTGAQLTGEISGTGSLIKSQYNGGNSGTLTLTAINTYSGDTIVDNGTLTLADNAALTFTIGTNGINNRVSGNAAVNLNGDFIFDLSGAAAVDGNLWNIISVNTLSESFSSTFLVQGFSDADNDNVWTNGGWSFSEATGSLSYTAIPEPSACALMSVAGFLILSSVRRKTRSSSV